MGAPPPGEWRNFSIWVARVLLPARFALLGSTARTAWLKTARPKRSHSTAGCAGMVGVEQLAVFDIQERRHDHRGTVSALVLAFGKAGRIDGCAVAVLTVNRPGFSR